MDLIINSTAVARSSLGVRRLFSGVMQHLAWHSQVSFPKLPRRGALGRGVELLQLGRRDAIFWSPTHSGPLWVRNHVITLHDCINVDYVYRNDWRLPAFRRLFNAVLANARVVVALSCATKQAALRNYTLDESKIVVIPAGFEMPAPAAALQPGPAGPPFILMVSNALAHKNSLRACRAFANSTAPQRGYILRVVGTLPEEARAACARHSDKIEVHAHITDALLRDWYKTAAFLFSPSLAEGFDLPIAEAIASGGNVLCSNIPVHLEFFQDCAIFFDPYSDESMIEALNSAVLKPQSCWFPALAHRKLRSYQDVADDYRALFHGIEREVGIRP